MKSIVKLYYKSLVQEDRNFIIDDRGANTISDYLNTLTSTTIHGFQYIKHDLTLSIKIDMSQVQLELGTDSKDLNYCSIANCKDDESVVERTIYYFISKKNWKSENTIELVLHMDTLNTFRINEDFIVSPKTLVKRMHKDRFSAIPQQTIEKEFEFSANSTTTFFYEDLIVSTKMGTITYSAFTTLQPYLHIDSVTFDYSDITGQPSIKIVVTNSSVSVKKATMLIRYTTPAVQTLIDFKSENIIAPLYKRNESLIIDKTDDGIEWSLYYKNKDNQDNAPVDCYLIPDAPLSIKYQATPGEINTGNLPSGKWAYFYPTYPKQPLSFKQGDTYIAPSFYQNTSGLVTYTDIRVVAIHNNSGTIELYWLRATQETFFGSTSVNYTKIGDGNVTIINSPEHLYGKITDSQIPENYNDVLDYIEPSNATDDFSMSALVDSTMTNLASIDKTLSENIKIIHIPYSPTPYTKSNNVYEFAQCWEYNTTNKMLKLVDSSPRWSNDIKTDLNDITYNLVRGLTINIGENRKIVDTKMYHSDFYKIKFVYDSFSKSFALENLDFWPTMNALNNRASFEFKFIMSRNLVSKFLFKFEYVYKYALEDYENIVAVARNNEEVLYSSQYLNYVRTGYNYDIKAKQRQEMTLQYGLAMSGASTIMSYASGNPTLGFMQTGSFVGQIINYANTTAQAEENIQRKLDETKRQAVSVLNADDYDLMYEYAQNKPKLCYYRVSDRMTKVLDDLFYYCGYSIDEQRIPDTNSRLYFNFVQCDLKIVETSNLTSDIENDIIEKFSQGVTFMHDVDGSWDLDQIKENWEMSLL